MRAANLSFFEHVEIVARGGCFAVRRRINCVEVEAILYIDKVKVRVRKKVLW